MMAPLSQSEACGAELARLHVFIGDLRRVVQQVSTNCDVLSLQNLGRQAANKGCAYPAFPDDASLGVGRTQRAAVGRSDGAERCDQNSMQ